MKVEEVAKLITDLKEYENAVEHLERSLKELKERQSFNIHISSDGFMDEHTIYFHYLNKLITKDMFQEFVQQCIDKFNTKISEIKNTINKMKVMP